MFLELLQKRRSVRQFQQKDIEADKVEYLIESMLRSPSSRGLDPWSFVVVEEKEKIAALAKAKTHGSTFMKNAALAIVICADPAKSDVWVEDCSIASILIHLAAADLGLGSCWVQIRRRQFDEKKSSGEYVSDIIGLDAGMEVEAIIAIGYPLNEPDGHHRDKLLWDRVSYNSYGNKK